MMKTVLTWLMAITTTFTQAEQLQIERSDIYTVDHTECGVLQGGALSFLDCKNTFEIYQTNELAKSPYENNFNAEKNAITYAHPTLERKKPGRITWFDAAQEGKTNNRVMSAISKDEVIENEHIMSLTFDDDKVVEGLWVFDNFVAVYFTDTTIAFYEKPLI